jgi:hypothetical protein
MGYMTDDFAQDVHDLLAEIRGVATSLTVGGPDAFVRNFELGVGAFARGPEHAVGIAAMMSVRRFEMLNEARVGLGSPSPSQGRCCSIAFRFARAACPIA